MRPIHPSLAPFLLSLSIRSISAQLDLGTQLAYPTEFHIIPVLASADGLISKEDWASNMDNKECHSPNSQRRMRARAYNHEGPPSAFCEYKPGAVAPSQYNLKQPPEADQLQLGGTKNDPNNPDPNPHPDNEKRKWWERLLIHIQDLARPGQDAANDNWRAPDMSSAICPDPNKQVAVCSAEIPYLPGPGELIIEYCRFLDPFISDCVQGEKPWCCKNVFATDIKPMENGNNHLTGKRTAYKLTGEYCVLLMTNLNL